MDSIRVTKVFTPGTFPVHTYVARDEAGVESQLRDALATPGQVISLSGPSKSGKTVLLERIVGLDNLIAVSGGNIATPEKLWESVLAWIEAPVATSATRTKQAALGSEIAVGASVTVGPVGGSVGVKQSESSTDSVSTTALLPSDGLKKVVKELKDSVYTILIRVPAPPSDRLVFSAKIPSAFGRRRPGALAAVESASPCRARRPPPSPGIT